MKYYICLFLLMPFALFSQWEKRIKVEVNPKIEVLCIIHHLAGYEQKENEYTQKVDSAFKKYRKHGAVKGLITLMENKTYIMAPDLIRTGVYFSNFPSFQFQEKHSEIDSFILKENFREKDLEKWFPLVEQFAKESHFMAFFEKNKPYYQSLVNEQRKKLLSYQRQWTLLEQFFGDKSQKEWNIYLCPLVNRFHAEALFVSEAFNQKHHPILLNTDFLTFESEYLRNPLVSLLAHEISHLYTSKALYTTYRNDLLAVAKAKKNRLPAYLFLYKVDETLVSGIATYLDTYILNKSQTAFYYEYKYAISNADAKELYDITFVMKALQEYDSNTKTYPTLAAFYPTLIKEVENWEIGEEKGR